MIAGDTSRLITASADTTVKIWDVETGAQLNTFTFGSPARAVDFAIGDKLAVITTDPFMGAPSAIHVKRVDRESIKGFLKHLPCYM
jgi:translation initiation factor 3 subunit I